MEDRNKAALGSSAAASSSPQHRPHSNAMRDKQNEVPDEVRPCADSFDPCFNPPASGSLIFRVVDGSCAQLRSSPSFKHIIPGVAPLLLGTMIETDPEAQTEAEG